MGLLAQLHVHCSHTCIHVHVHVDLHVCTMYMYLDGDEVSLALVGDGLCQQCLATARRTIEQHPLGGSHAKLEELLRMLNWVLDKGTEGEGGRGRGREGETEGEGGREGGRGEGGSGSGGGKEGEREGRK